MLRFRAGLGILPSPSASPLGWEAKAMIRAPWREGVVQDTNTWSQTPLRGQWALQAHSTWLLSLPLHPGREALELC